jgi:hypothetical protein
MDPVFLQLYEAVQGGLTDLLVIPELENADILVHSVWMSNLKLLLINCIRIIV